MQVVLLFDHLLPVVCSHHPRNEVRHNGDNDNENDDTADDDG